MLPTRRLLTLLLVPLMPAVVAIAWPPALWLALAGDAALLALFVVDGLRAPARDAVALQRLVEPVVSAGVANRVELRLDNRTPRTVFGEVSDLFPLQASATRTRQPFALPPHARVHLGYTFTPSERGDQRFGDVLVRFLGPWGLAARQRRYPAAMAVKAYPALAAFAPEGLAQARPTLEAGLMKLRAALGEGRAFESLREYVPGDDVRAIDWKATAKAQRPIARQYEPERNQTVMLVLDCGRHMVSRVDGRTKLDHAIDALLRLARVSLDKGDQVGLCAFGSKVLAVLPPKKGRAHLKAMVELLYRLQPELTESDYAAAYDAVSARLKRRALVVTFTDLLDEDSSREVLGRTLHLRPRHLPLLVAVTDTELERPARKVPQSAAEAYERAAARKIVRERERTAARLRDAGALVLAAPAEQLSVAAVNAYLAIKARGLL